MQTLNVLWQPSWDPIPYGLSIALGRFWIKFNDENKRGEIVIRITVPAISESSAGYFASLTVYYDGIELLHELDHAGFLKRFQETHARTFYDVFKCFHESDINVTSQDPDKRLIGNRRMYEMLTTKGTT